MKKQSNKKNQLVIVGVCLAILLIGAIVVYALKTTGDTPRSASINSFKECADAGYPIQESYPEVCTVPDGQSFTNN